MNDQEENEYEQQYEQQMAVEPFAASAPVGSAGHRGAGAAHLADIPQPSNSPEYLSKHLITVDTNRGRSSGAAPQDTITRASAPPLLDADSAAAAPAAAAAVSPFAWRQLTAAECAVLGMDHGLTLGHLNRAQLEELISSEQAALQLHLDEYTLPCEQSQMEDCMRSILHMLMWPLERRDLTQYSRQQDVLRTIARPLVSTPFLTAGAVTTKEYYAHWSQLLSHMWGPPDAAAQLTPKQSEFRAYLIQRGWNDFRQLVFPDRKRPTTGNDALPAGKPSIKISEDDMKEFCTRFGLQNDFGLTEHGKQVGESLSQFKFNGFIQWLLDQPLRMHHLLALEEQDLIVPILATLHSRKTATDVLSHLYHLFQERLSGSYLNMFSLFGIEKAKHDPDPQKPILTFKPLTDEVWSCLMNDNLSIVRVAGNTFVKSHIVTGWRMLRHCEWIIDFFAAQNIWFKIGLTVTPLSRFDDHRASGWQGMVVMFECASVREAVLGEMMLINTYYAVTDEDEPRPLKSHNKCDNDRNKGGAPGGDPAKRALKEPTTCSLYVLWSEQEQRPRETADDTRKRKSDAAELDLAPFNGTSGQMAPSILGDDDLFDDPFEYSERPPLTQSESDDFDAEQDSEPDLGYPTENIIESDDAADEERRSQARANEMPKSLDEEEE